MLHQFMRDINHTNVQFVTKYNCSQRSNMKQHVASVHEKKKPYKCNICDNSFAVMNALKKHIASVHEGIKPFICEICDKDFSRVEILNRHASLVHQGKKCYIKI